MLASFRLLAGREMAPDAREWFKARFKVSATPDRRSRSVLRFVSAQPERAAVIVADAGIYRDDEVEPYVAPEAATPLLPQDVWVPQVHALAAAAVEIARERSLYVALDTNELTPTREALADLLLSIDGCGVMGSSNEEDLGTILAARVDRRDGGVDSRRTGGLTCSAKSMSCRRRSTGKKPTSAFRCSTERDCSRKRCGPSARR